MLLVAPLTLRGALLDLIRTEASRPNARIVMKVNALADPQIIDELYEASRRGARIDLLIRGICCLRPGVPGLSEGIRVRSIVGRYLEHSRIFRFGDGRRETMYHIGSADLMARNLDHRVEAVAPVTEPDLRARLDEILDACLDRDTPAWELGPDGAWSKVGSGGGLSIHARLQALAVARAGLGAVGSSM